MGEALKKHLTKLEVKPGDLVLFKPPLGAPPSDYRGFVIEVAQQLALDNLGPVVVVQPGFTWDTLTNEQLNGMGMMRLWPPGESTTPLEVLEDQALAAVRIAFANARQMTEERIARQAAADSRNDYGPDAVCPKSACGKLVDAHTAEEWAAHIAEATTGYMDGDDWQPNEAT